jgi:2-polyprenyl-3-methyl-5-hydroxy-6-metoxy-1,4-benzoquinol methylase
VNRYQDRWCRGVVVERGERPCGDRFAVIADHLESSRPRTGLDLGANLGYFSMRLADRFGMIVDAVESLHYQRLVDAVTDNGDDRVLPIHTQAETVLRSDIYGPYDVVLALSVLHHLEMPYAEALSHLRRLGETVIVELATEPNACGQRQVAGQFIPEGAVMLGEFPSHLGGTRPLFVL